MTNPQTWEDLCAVLALHLARLMPYGDGRRVVLHYEEIESAPDVDVVWDQDREIVEITVQTP